MSARKWEKHTSLGVSGCIVHESDLGNGIRGQLSIRILGVSGHDGFRKSYKCAM